MFPIPVWVTAPAKVVWAIIKKIPPEFLIYLAIVAGAMLYGHIRYKAGVADTLAEVAEKNKPLEQASAKVTEAVAPVAKQVEQQVTAKAEEVRYVTRYIIKEVPKYVPADTPDLPAGFRRLHDAAAEGRDPGSPEYADAEAVGAQDVAATVAENYGICRENAIRLKGWQDFWSGVEAACRQVEGCKIIPPATGAGKE